ncbi:transcriptional regulator TetR family [Vibrio variabilis]|uniref:Transcriptional regulator TetR family n=1 Tax=Vibrio variabilis TaxID=990271 RepID=A0ABQ0JBD3_9VIBR|nr:transcriptional regulator TetR family [Vibrio variabilis]
MTVKPKKRGRPEKGKDGLSQERIVETAKAMMKADGKIPSIRALAKELNIDAMAIYHYFNNKDSVLEAVAISLVEAFTSQLALLAGKMRCQSWAGVILNCLVNIRDFSKPCLR